MQTQIFETQHAESQGGGGELVRAGTRTASSRDEMNLAEFPIAVLSTRVDPKIKTLEFSDSQRLKTGEVLERKWIITGTDKFGLPTATDDDVVLGLMRLSMDQGFRHPKVYFSRYELLKILRWSTEGRSYSRITKSLDRLSGVRIRATNSFYDNQLKSYQTQNFGIIDAYEINDERGHCRDDSRKSFFIWSEVLFESFKSGFIKKIDLELYFHLKSAVSRRLYRYLDKHFYYKNVIERPLMTLAFEKLGVSRNYKYVSSVKQQVEPAAQELVEVGFLSGYEFFGRGAATSVRFALARAGDQAAPRRSARAIPVPAPQTADAPTPENPTANAGSAEEERRRLLLAALIERGIHQEQAQRLLGAASPQQLEKASAIIAYYDELLARGDYKVSKNPVGFLYRAVEHPERFSLPLEYQKPRVANRPTKSAQRPEADPRRKELEAAYKRYQQQSLEQFRAEIGEVAVGHIRAQISERMSCLRSVLEKARFEEAVEGCVKEELLKAAGLKSYRDWITQ